MIVPVNSKKRAEACGAACSKESDAEPGGTAQPLGLNWGFETTYGNIGVYNIDSH